MDAVNLNQLLMIYAWFPLTALIVLLLLVARFYWKQTGESTNYLAFGAPALLFGLAVVQYARVNAVMGDPLGDLLMFLGGTVLAVLCLLLYRRMTKGR